MNFLEGICILEMPSAEDFKRNNRKSTKNYLQPICSVISQRWRRLRDQSSFLRYRFLDVVMTINPEEKQPQAHGKKRNLF
jgi:hypothetical protein